MISTQSLDEILGVELSQEDINLTNESSIIKEEKLDQKYVVTTVDAPQSFIDRLNKLLEAAHVANTIIKSGKINYYTAESLFSIYPFISEADVNRTTKNMSTINYDSIKKTMLTNMSTYAKTLKEDVTKKWIEYKRSYHLVADTDIIIRTINKLHAFSIENKDLLKALVSFYYTRKFNIVRDNEEEEVYIKFSELDEENIKKYEEILKKDSFFNFIIMCYTYFNSKQLSFSELKNKLNWLKVAMVNLFIYSKVNTSFSSINPLIESMSILYNLSIYNNEDLNKLIDYILSLLNKQYECLKDKYNVVCENLDTFTDKINDINQIEIVRMNINNLIPHLALEMRYIEDIKFIHKYTVKNTQLLTDIKEVLDGIKQFM